MSSVRNVSALAVLTGLISLAAACASDPAGPESGSAGNVAQSTGGGNADGGKDSKGGTGGVPGSAGAGAAEAGAAAASEAGAGGQSLDSACSAYASARCTRFQACVPTYFPILYSSLADCEQATLVLCRNELSAPGTSRTAESLAECASDMAAQNCADWQGPSPPSCELPGSRADNTPCEYDSQCESTLCLRATQSWCGVCKARDIAGAACDAGQATCVHGLRCANGCTNGDICDATDKHFRCAEAKAKGAVCENITQCQGALTCLGGICTTGVGVGEACDRSVSGNCERSADLACVEGPNGGTCVKNAYLGANAVCNIATAQQCSGLGKCNGTDGRYTSTGPGICMPPGGEGEACSSDKVCRQPALCLGGVCTSPVDAATCH